MLSLFRKKELAQAFAEVLEDGRALMNDMLKKPRYRGEYSGPEPTFDVRVRVQPENEPPFEAPMKVTLTHAFLLKPGVRVQVKYDAARHDHVTLDDDNQAILDRNPQLKKTA